MKKQSDQVKEPSNRRPIGRGAFLTRPGGIATGVAVMLVSALCLRFSLCVSSVSGAGIHLTFTKFTVPFPDVDQTGANGINDHGQIVGGYHHISTGGHGVMDDHGQFTSFDFPIPGTRAETAASGINNRGQIVGFIDAFPGGNCCERHGFILEQGVFRFLDVPFPGVTETTVTGINDRGQIIGVYSDSNGQHGFVFDHGEFTSVDVPFPGTVTTSLSGINNRGQIVGVYNDSNGLHSFVFDHGVFTPFNGPDGIAATVFGINDQGQIVGATGGHGFVFDHGEFTFLDVPFPDARQGSTVVVGINNKGEIVGFYSEETGTSQGFVAR